MTIGWNLEVDNGTECEVSKCKQEARAPRELSTAESVDNLRSRSLARSPSSPPSATECDRRSAAGGAPAGGSGARWPNSARPPAARAASSSASTATSLLHA